LRTRKEKDGSILFYCESQKCDFRFTVEVEKKETEEETEEDLEALYGFFVYEFDEFY
jgi:hypothetical protein